MGNSISNILFLELANRIAMSVMTIILRGFEVCYFVDLRERTAVINNYLSTINQIDIPCIENIVNQF